MAELLSARAVFVVLGAEEDVQLLCATARDGAHFGARVLSEWHDAPFDARAAARLVRPGGEPRPPRETAALVIRVDGDDDRLPRDEELIALGLPPPARESLVDGLEVLGDARDDATHGARQKVSGRVRASVGDADVLWYGDRRDFIFSGFEGRTRRKMRLDLVAEYSVTPSSTAAETNARLRQAGVAETARVIDGCASAGGNALSFAGAFRGGVVAVERDPQRCAMLRHNASVIAAPLGCMRVVEGCFVELLRAATAADDAEAAGTGDEAKLLLAPPSGAGDDGTMLFLDPPWGGPEAAAAIEAAERGAARRAATAARDAAIGLGDLSLPALVAGPIADARAKLGLRWLVLKVPRDYDERAVADACRGGTWRVSSVESVRKMKLVILVADGSPATVAPATAAPRQGGRYVPPHRRR